jgi:hypothetical protein
MAGFNQHQRFAEVLRALGFIPNKAEVENNTVYVKDLMISERNPKEIVQKIEEKTQFQVERSWSIDLPFRM